MQDTPDGEKTAEMACSCVLALVAFVIIAATVIMLVMQRVK